MKHYKQLNENGETLYKSLLDAIVWTPEVHPAGWEIVE